MKKIYYCKECGKQVSDYRKNYCVKCWQLGERNHNYKGGTTQYYCKKCKKKITYNSTHYGLGLCVSCGYLSRKNKIQKENHPKWKGGKPKCIDCGKTLSAYNYTRCIKCARKYFAKRGKDCIFYGKSPKAYKIFYKNNRFKSFWEYRFVRWLELSKIEWNYEPKAFKLTVNNKETHYIPDFYLPKFDCYIEIKGWWRDDAKEKFIKFKKVYSSINIKVFNKKELLMIGVL